MSSAGSGAAAVRPAAFLVDVYQTILTCDFELLRDEMSALAGVRPAAWDAGFARHGAEFSTGRMSLAEGFEEILRTDGIWPADGVVSELVRRNRELLAASSRLFDDAMPFLQELRARGIPVALVSNCDENTRWLLADLGVTELADALVLSCEVGCVKPDARIYQHALGELGVPAGAAVFVDDQPAYCAGAVALGMPALQLSRGNAARPAPGTSVISSLLQALPDS